jgi:hypothetical protein
MMTKFEDRLFDELMTEHGAGLPAQRAANRTRTVARPVWLSGGVLAAAGATAAGLVMVGGGGAQAFAVTQNSNGTATIAVHDMSAIAGANAKLHALGDNVVIVPVKAGCPSMSTLPGVPHVAGQEVTSSGSVSKDGQITVNVTGIPAGDIAVVAIQQTGNMTEMASQITTPPGPACVSMPTPPPGGGTVTGG